MVRQSGSASQTPPSRNTVRAPAEEPGPHLTHRDDGGEGGAAVLRRAGRNIWWRSPLSHTVATT